MPMTMGDYALAMAFDNAPTVANPNQADSDHNGIGDVIDHAVIAAADVVLGSGSGTLQATLTAQAGPIANQDVVFKTDINGDGTDETFHATTNTAGVATVMITSSRPAGSTFAYTASWDGVLIQASDNGLILIPDMTPPHVLAITPALATVQCLDTPGLDAVTIRFDKDVHITAADVSIQGLDSGAGGGFSFVYNQATFTVTLGWPVSLGDDTYVLTIRDTVTNTTGIALDGECNLYSPVLPSGNGAAGGPFRGLIYRLVGDCNGDRSVDMGDLLAMAATWGLTAGDPGYSASSDLNSNSTVDVVDLLILADHWARSILVGP